MQVRPLPPEPRYIVGMSKETRTYEDRKDYLNAATKKRRKKIKEMAIEYKGGKCICCGYNKYVGALEFHHLDPKEKDFSISAKGITRSWVKVKEELDKCILVCSVCHREIHGGVRDLPVIEGA